MGNGCGALCATAALLKSKEMNAMVRDV